MKEEDLNRIIEILEDNSSEDDAYFEFKFDNDGFCHIKSNEEGIVLFSKEILKTTKDFKNEDEANRKDIRLNTGTWFIHDNFFASYVEPVYKKRKEIDLPVIERKTRKETLVKLLFSVFLILIGISIIVGMINIFNWLIDLI